MVAACLDIAERQRREEKFGREFGDGSGTEEGIPQEYLTPEEIRDLALESRRDRAKKEEFSLIRGETIKGFHRVRTSRGKDYTVTVYNLAEERGHCSCPDFASNHLDTCKHLIFACNQLQQEEEDPDLLLQKEPFPFVHFTWNSRLHRPVVYYEGLKNEEVRERVETLFNEKGVYTRESLKGLYELYSRYDGEDEPLCFDSYLLERMEDYLWQKESAKLAKGHTIDLSFLKTCLYPYQEEGVRFGVFKKAAIIADEMGLGKTLQAISIALLKKEIFGFQKILVVCPSSVKSQWQKEIEKFTDASAVVISGRKDMRRQIYKENPALFKITNYEALLRDISTVSRWCPDFVILDEAQRIKNFETKTHHALQQLPRNHSLVITGTPLENKLEDLYSIIQFSDPTLLTPLWAFAARHFNLSTTRKNRVLGYRNLDAVHEKIAPLLLRRRKADVLENLPEKIENNYYLDLSPEQEEMHQGYLSGLFSIMNKKVLTPMDIKRMQQILLAMRMICDSTYLVDKETNISPKLVELVSILKDLVLENRRKVIIFSEWTTMIYLIGKVLSELGINFVEFTGKVPVKKRQSLIDEFRTNPDCMVFLSTDAGGVGLNLQNTDCLINFELPWNPAKLNQRIGRIHRIGQKSSSINVINLISRNSIEEKVYAGINLKQELFDAALEGTAIEVDLSRERKNRFVNQVRTLFQGDETAQDEADAALIRNDERPEGEREKPELDEKTPHFLNPEIFREPERVVDISAEETLGEEARVEEEGAARNGREGDKQSEGPAQIRPEQMEAVLNQGMSFLNSLAMMATGRPITGDDTNKAVEIDRETGEVVMRFKLPGF
ncbi:DEAD/DEAH box helicase [Marispirochaeta sp.]|uniref:DEAD/DEAH box helicase n=1 Tax=Marispirochaeta sp. TaxID=2038653 RepID=UPI0029C7BEC1|nr:DEAD/DEAH box helicase [Marispirochaeta sp.]